MLWSRVLAAFCFSRLFCGWEPLVGKSGVGGLLEQVIAVMEDWALLLFCFLSSLDILLRGIQTLLNDSQGWSGDVKGHHCEDYKYLNLDDCHRSSLKPFFLCFLLLISSSLTVRFKWKELSSHQRLFFKMQHEHVFLSCKDRHVCGLSTSAPGKQIYLIAAPNRNSVLWLICLMPGSDPSRSAVVSKPMPSVKRDEQNGDWNAVLIPCWGSEPISCCSRCMGALQPHSGEANESSLFVWASVSLCFSF